MTAQLSGRLSLFWKSEAVYSKVPRLISRFYKVTEQFGLAMVLNPLVTRPPQPHLPVADDVATKLVVTEEVKVDARIEWVVAMWRHMQGPGR
jgi:hypothetical protein